MAHVFPVDVKDKINVGHGIIKSVTYLGLVSMLHTMHYIIVRD